MINVSRITQMFPLRGAIQCRQISQSFPVFDPTASTKPAVKDADKEKAKKQKEKEKEKARKQKDAMKTKLNPPKQAPTPWQLFFTEELEKARQQGKVEIGVISHSASELYKKLTDSEKQPYIEQSKQLRTKQAKEFADYIKSLPLDLLKKENSIRSKLRKQGKKGGVQRIKDPNAPKRPLTAYFAYLKDLRENDSIRREVFGDSAVSWIESSIIEQSKTASDKWKELSESFKQTYKDRATEAKKKYEQVKHEYENSFL